MKRRIEAVVEALPGLRMRPGHALRQAFAEGYGLKNLRSDVLAGIVVGIVALPLSMALAIASGVPPQYGLYTAIVAGGLIALAGGLRVQVSGPTAAFVVILAPISAKFGLGGLLVATMIAGVLLLLMGLLRFGQLIQFIPYPVTTGFTAGIAVVIATLQLNDFLGLGVTKLPEHYADKVYTLIKAMPNLHWPDLTIGLGTLMVLLIWPRMTRKIPAPLIALPVAAVAALLLVKINSDWQVATIFSRFPQTNGVPQQGPMPGWPWAFPGANGQPLIMDFTTFRALLVAGFAIAMLGAIESLLSAVVSDGMTVPAIDATGLVNLQSTIKRLHSDNILIVLGGVQPQPMEVLTKAKLEEIDSRIGICRTIEEAVTMAKFHVALGEDLHEAAGS